MSKAGAKIRKNHILFNGIRYFRGNAEEIQVGSYGEKRTPSTAKYLENKGYITILTSAIEQPTSVEISSFECTEADFNANGSDIYKGVAIDGEIEVNYEDASSAEVKLVKFSLPASSMAEYANVDDNALEDLREYGNKARIAHQIWVVMEAELADAVVHSTDTVISVSRGRMEFKLHGKFTSSSVTTVTISAGTTFAYLLAKPRWDYHKKKKRNEIVDLDDDQWGGG